MKKYGCRGSLVLCCFLIISFIIGNIPLRSIPLLMEIGAEHKKFEVEKFNENITIPPDAIGFIDFNLQEGEEFEVIFTLQVKEDLPIDIWFVNEDHYLLLVNGAQFLYFIDGSEHEVSYTKKIVTLMEHDLYKLVMTNYYNNQTVEVNIVYEIRTYYADSDETSSEDLSIFMFPLLLAVVIFIVLIIVLLFKIRNYKQTISNISEKRPIKKSKKNKHKETKPKVSEKATLKKAQTQRPKFLEPKASLQETSKNTKTVVSEQKEPEIPEKGASSFCGHCGKPVTTKFCTYCGKKV